MKEKKVYIASDHPGYTSHLVLAILLPVIGFFIGLLYAVKSDRLDNKLGRLTMKVSAIFIIVQIIAIIIF